LQYRIKDEVSHNLNFNQDYSEVIKISDIETNRDRSQYFDDQNNYSFYYQDDDKGGN